MANTLLLLEPNDIIKNTQISGNIDIDYLYTFIKVAQLTDIKRILTTNLYNRILNDFRNGTLAGEYQFIYDEFVVDMLSYFSAGRYLEFGHTKISNAGVFKSTGSSYNATSSDENDKLSKAYLSLANSLELGFVDYMKGVTVTEYKKDCSTDNSFGFNWHI